MPFEHATGISWARNPKFGKEYVQFSVGACLVLFPMSKPLVSVICLNYNQSRFLPQAIQSVLDQTYENVEIILCNDASTDNSYTTIDKLIVKNPEIQVIRNTTNLGNCKTFNKGLSLAKGSYIIDLAADDILQPERIAIGVADLDRLGEEFGVHHGNVLHVDEDGNDLHAHFSQEEQGPEGDVYELLIKKYAINPVSMMMRKSVLDSLGGYDESLAYEDFDFWIRSSREWKYAYSDQFLVKKRVVGNSLSSVQSRLLNRHQRSTFAVCEKIYTLNKAASEDRALRQRIVYEIGQCVKTLNFLLIPGYLSLLVNLAVRKF